MVFREVLIYQYNNNLIKLWNTGYQQIYYQFVQAECKFGNSIHELPKISDF